MESFDLISKLLDGRVVIGKKEEVAPDLFIIPVYKLKITIFNLNADMKNNNSSGDTSSLTASPICLLKIQNSNVDISSNGEWPTGISYRFSAISNGISPQTQIQG